MEDANDDDNLLLPFERQILHDPLRQYTRIKRNNRFATMQALPEIWTAVELLDSILDQEFRDLYTITEATVPLPLSLFMGSFVRMRIAFELGLTGYIGESADLMRGAVEYGVHGKRILEHPELATIWLDKDKGKKEFDAYREAFEREKKQRLFNDQDALHHYWTQFSEWGSHSTKAALALRLRFTEGEDLKSTFEFFETDHTRLANFLLMLLDTANRLEILLFECFPTRLTLDVQLGDMRARCQRILQQAHSSSRDR